jgi:hypothetical protein
VDSFKHIEENYVPVNASYFRSLKDFFRSFPDALVTVGRAESNIFISGENRLGLLRALIMQTDEEAKEAVQAYKEETKPPPVIAPPEVKPIPIAAPPPTVPRGLSKEDLDKLFKEFSIYLPSATDEEWLEFRWLLERLQTTLKDIPSKEAYPRARADVEALAKELEKRRAFPAVPVKPVEVTYPVEEWGVIYAPHFKPPSYVFTYQIKGNWSQVTFNTLEEVNALLRKGRETLYVPHIRGKGLVTWMPTEIPPLRFKVGEQFDTPTETYTLEQPHIRSDKPRMWIWKVAIWDKVKNESRSAEMTEEDWQNLKIKPLAPPPKKPRIEEIAEEALKQLEAL